MSKSPEPLKKDLVYTVHGVQKGPMERIKTILLLSKEVELKLKLKLELKLKLMAEVGNLEIGVSRLNALMSSSAASLSCPENVLQVQNVKEVLSRGIYAMKRL